MGLLGLLSQMSLRLETEVGRKRERERESERAMKGKTQRKKDRDTQTQTRTRRLRLSPRVRYWVGREPGTRPNVAALFAHRCPIVILEPTEVKRTQEERGERREERGERNAEYIGSMPHREHDTPYDSAQVSDQSSKVLGAILRTVER